MELIGIEMEAKKRKYNLPVITAEAYHFNPERYELHKGSSPDAPPCPFGHRFKWIGFDKKAMTYVRVTKSVFKKMIVLKDEDEVEQHEKLFERYKLNL